MTSAWRTDTRTLIAALRVLAAEIVSGDGAANAAIAEAADRMQEMADGITDAVREERERCAKACDAWADLSWGRWDAHADPHDQGAALASERLAQAIRRLGDVEVS